MIYFTADTHFGHRNIMRESKRPFGSVERMENRLVSAINRRVKPSDELYVLGDFSFRIGVDQAREIRKRIRCRKVHLIPGNHDKDWTRSEVAGTFIVEPHVSVMKIGAGRKIVMCHYPLMTWPSRRNGSIHIHGHVHEGPGYNEWNRSQGLLRYDVGVDANRYAPISLDELLAFFDGVEVSAEPDRPWAVR